MVLAVMIAAGLGFANKSRHIVAAPRYVLLAGRFNRGSSVRVEQTDVSYFISTLAPTGGGLSCY